MVTGEGWSLDRQSSGEDSDWAGTRLQESLLVGAVATVRQAIEQSCGRSGRSASGWGAGTNPGWRQGRDEDTSDDGAGCGGEEVAGRGAVMDGRSGRGGNFRSKARASGDGCVRVGQGSTNLRRSKVDHRKLNLIYVG
jgi:hypothetical protein